MLSTTPPVVTSRSFVWCATDHPSLPYQVQTNGNWYINQTTGLQTMLVGGIALAETEFVSGGVVYLVPQDGRPPFRPENFTRIYFFTPKSSPLAQQYAQKWWTEVQESHGIVETEDDMLIPTFHVPQVAVQGADGQLTLSLICTGPMIPSDLMGQLDAGGLMNTTLLKEPTMMMVMVNPGNKVAWIARCDRDSWVWTACL